MKTKEEILKDCNIQVEILQEEKPLLLHNILKAMDIYGTEVINKNVVLPDVRKRYKFTFGDVETETLIIIHEDTERKAYKAAFRTFETPKDRELRLISKELNAF